jgi:AcrR family transcriptional regulator
VSRAVSAAPARRRRVRLDNDARRAQILSLARAAFSHRAYDDISIDDLAAEAKISKGLLYHYFPTKRDLYVAGLSEIAAELVHAVTSAPGNAATSAPIDRVRAGLEAYLDFITRHARAFVSLMRGGIGSDPAVADIVDGVRRSLFDSLLTESPFTTAISSSPRLQTAIRGWIGAVEAVSIDWCARTDAPGRLSQQELRDLLVAMLFASIRAVAPALV